jgi:hypothetical protein
MLIRRVTKKIGFDIKKKLVVQVSNEKFEGAKLKLDQGGFEFFGDPEVTCTYHGTWLKRKEKPDGWQEHHEVWICVSFLKANSFRVTDNLWIDYSLEDRDASNPG